MTNKKFQGYSTLKNAVAETLVGAVARMFGFFGMTYASKMYGATGDTDVIYYALAVTTAISGVFCAINGNILMPQFLNAQREGNEIGAWNLACSAFTVSVGFVALIMLLGCLGFVSGLSVISHFQPSDIARVRAIAPVLALALLACYTADLLTAIYRGYRNFLMPNIAMTAGSACGLGLYLFAGHILGPEAIAIVFCVSWVVQAIIMWLLLLRHKKILWFRLRRFENQSTIIKLVPPLLLNQLGAIVVMLFPNFVASGLEDGALTALTYARRLFDLVPALLILPIANALAPMLSDMIAKSSNAGAGVQVQKTSAFLLSCTIPISVFVLYHAQLLTIVLFGSRNYGATHQALTADAMRWFMLGLMTLATNAIITRAIMMTQNVRAAYVSLVLSIAATLGIPLCIKLAVAHMGSVGVAAGNTFYLVLVHQILGYLILAKMLGGFDIVGEAKAITKPALFASVAGAVSVLPVLLNGWPQIVQLLLSSAVFMGGYAAIHAASGSWEYRMIMEKIRSSRVAS